MSEAKRILWVGIESKRKNEWIKTKEDKERIEDQETWRMRK